MDNLFLVRCREIECFIDLLGHVAGEYNVLYFLSMLDISQSESKELINHMILYYPITISDQREASEAQQK